MSIRTKDGNIDYKKLLNSKWTLSCIINNVSSYYYKRAFILKYKKL